jgi:hypothetical protein
LPLTDHGTKQEDQQPRELSQGLHLPLIALQI